MQTLTLEAQINDLASRTCSVVHARDLRATGIGRDAVARRVANRTMAIVLPRTYAVGPQCQQPTFDMRCMAGVLAAGTGAYVDGAAAAVQYGAWDRDDGTVVVTQPGCAITRREGFEFHRADMLWIPRHARTVGPIPVVGFGDLCLRMAVTHTKWQVAFVIGRGMYRRLITLGELDQLVAVSTNVRGVATLRDAITLVRSGSAGSRSEAEDLLLAALRRRGVPEPIVNTKGVLGMPRDEPDLVWRRGRLNIEIDGRQHDDPIQMADDRRRDAAVIARGYSPVRVAARHVHRRCDDVCDRIIDALAGRPIDVDPQSRYLRV